ncbi:MAG: SRPBCC domain-containing protein [Bacteroidota bacterium]
MKSIHKFYRIKGAPEDLYAAMTNSFSIELWTGAPARMSTVAGEEFSLFDGDIEGLNISFEPDRRIEQEWYFGEQEEKSMVILELSQEKHFTRIELTHTNIPDDAFEDMKYGWDNYYFGGLKDFFEK